jgi:hypothetical protein
VPNSPTSTMSCYDEKAYGMVERSLPDDKIAR